MFCPMCNKWTTDEIQEGPNGVRVACASIRNNRLCGYTIAMSNNMIAMALDITEKRAAKQAFLPMGTYACPNCKDPYEPSQPRTAEISTTGFLSIPCYICKAEMLPISKGVVIQ